MKKENLLRFRQDTFSQNGEDGIIAELFRRLGDGNRTCCEFGAWDGIHLSNTRKLILAGWEAVLIEGDSSRYHDLTANYAGHPEVHCVNAYVNDTTHTLSQLLMEHDITELDFLSIDIDGFDYFVLETLDTRPRVICVEVNAGHRPDTTQLVARQDAEHNVGEPLGAFVELARRMGYGLVCYTGNAFFVREDELEDSALDTLTAVEAYEAFLGALDPTAREWLYLVNKGLVEPHRQFENPWLRGTPLEIPWSRRVSLLRRHWGQRSAAGRR